MPISTNPCQYQNSDGNSLDLFPLSISWKNVSPKKKESMINDPLLNTVFDNSLTKKSMTPLKTARNNSAIKSPFNIVNKMFDSSPFMTSITKRLESQFDSAQQNTNLKKIKKDILINFNETFFNSIQKEKFVFYSENKKNSNSNNEINNLINEEQIYEDNYCLNFESPLINDNIFPIFKVENKIKEKIDLSNKKCSGCNCKHSFCIKMYCECFRKGICCKNCNCIGCENFEGSILRNKKINQILKKNPNAFNVQLNNDNSIKKHSKGCNCKKNHCQKNYCECHQLGVKCSELCHCIECKNVDANNLSIEIKSKV